MSFLHNKKSYILAFLHLVHVYVNPMLYIRVMEILISAVFRWWNLRKEVSPDSCNGKRKAEPQIRIGMPIQDLHASF